MSKRPCRRPGPGGAPPGPAPGPDPEPRPDTVPVLEPEPAAFAQVFEAERPRLISLSYRMLGSVAEAEDAVQDAWLRWRRRESEADEGATLDVPAAWLTRVVTRLCLDRLRQARRRRETYVGEWLPEPLAQEATAEEAAEAADDISFALMLALERLSPLERAAFLLHDVFGQPFVEVAATLGRDEAACRQLAARGRDHARQARPRFAVDPAAHDRIAAAFFQAARTGDAAALGALLAREAVLRSDGGGRARAALNPIRGAEKIARFFAGVARKGAAATSDEAPPAPVSLRLNGLPGWLMIGADGGLQSMAVEVAGDRVETIYLTRNPDKLRRLAPLILGSG